MIKQEITPISLLDFNRRIKSLLNDASVAGVWLQAETSDFHVRGGHCYLELIQKDSNSGATLARLSAIIWANNFNRINYEFATVTGTQLSTGMKIMVLVTASFHESFGLKAVISDVNPEFTLGDMARRRQEILNRLEKEGIIEDNKKLIWAPNPQRIAVISAPGAAGYGDFMNQLHNNSYHIAFYTCLFSATMQGNNTVPSVIDALNRIGENEDLFDCVVIIRGGGSTSDLNAFDNYDLAANIAQFPLPVIVGIGHERDVTVLDYVAAERVKTPTAAAEKLIALNLEQLELIDNIAQLIVQKSRDITATAKEQLSYYLSQIPLTATRIIAAHKLKLNTLAQTLPHHALNQTTLQRHRLQRIADAIKASASQKIEKESLKINSLSDMVMLLDPQNTLNRGYSITLKDGIAVTDATQLATGDNITTILKNGTINSTIE